MSEHGCLPNISSLLGTRTTRVPIRNDSGQDIVPAQEYCNNKRENHRTVEKRRRDKMRGYLTDLQNTVIPWSGPYRRPSKLNVLQEAAALVKSLGDLEPKKLGEPWLFTYEQLKNLLAEGARGFLFMVTCDTGNVVSVTDTVSRVLNRSQEDWLGTTIYDQVHPSDIGKIREQLSIDRNYGRTLDLRAATVRNAASSKHPDILYKRRFVCRMKIGAVEDCMISANPLKPANRLGTDDYAVVHCSGYVKPRYRTESDGNKDLFCLIALGRLEMIPSTSACGCDHFLLHTTDASDSFKKTEFVLKLSPDEKIVFADERTADFLGFRPNQLLGESAFNFIHTDDHVTVRNRFQEVTQLDDREGKLVCRFKSKNCEWIWIQMVAIAFRNPFSNEIEFIICTCFNARSTEVSYFRTISNFNSNVNNTSFLQASNISNGGQKPNFPLEYLLAPDSATGIDATLNENNTFLMDITFNAMANYN